MGICCCLVVTFAAVLSEAPPKKRHLDRSDSEYHRESRSRERPPHFAFAFAVAVVFAFAVAVAQSQLFLPLLLSSAKEIPSCRCIYFFCVFRPKIACQAPEPFNSFPTNNIRGHKYT